MINSLKKEISAEEDINKIKELCLDREENNLVKLSIQNILKVNAMIKENSRYTLDMYDDKIPPDKDFVNFYLTKFINNKPYEEKYKNKYCGSTSWWVKQLKNLKSDNQKQYEIIISGLIHDIDRMNTTHLNADKEGNKNGRYLAFKKIINEYDKTKLIEALKNEEQMPLIRLISKQDENNKFNFSFATKFCHYISWNYFDDPYLKDMYSIYDGIVSKNLPKYIEMYKENEEIQNYFLHTKKLLSDIDNKIVKKYFYKNTDEIKNTFFNSFFSNPFFKAKDNQYNEESILIFYKIYRDAIDAIRKNSANGGNLISRNAFDHLLWYGNKGPATTTIKELSLEEILNSEFKWSL